MSLSNEQPIHPVAVPSSIKSKESSSTVPSAAAGNIHEKSSAQPVETVVQDHDPNVVLVDYEENDPLNPLNWSTIHKWLIVFAVSWMGFVSVFSTTSIVPTAPQILEEFHSHSASKRVLLVTIWELGEGIGPFFIAPLSERYGRLPVFHIGNFLALCCLVGCALSTSIDMLIAFRFLTGCFLSILTLGPAVVGDLFPEEHSGKAMALTMGLQIGADFISPLGGAYTAHGLGWRWSIWVAVIVLGFFASLLALVLRETYSVTILKRKAARLQAQNQDGKTYRSKHQAHVDASTLLERAIKPLSILYQSPILILTTAYMTITYSLLSLVIATLTTSMESAYPNVFNTGSIGLTFLSLAIGNTVSLFFYSFTSDRYVEHQKKIKGDAYKPESRFVHLLIGAITLPIGFIIYGWTLNFHVQYIVPLVGTALIGFSSLLCTITPETYVVDVYKVHGASGIAAGVIFRAICGALLPLIGPALYESIGDGWGNTVLAFISVVFIPPLVSLMVYGDWWRSKDRFGSSPR